MRSFRGRVFRGQGVGQSFTQIDWVRSAFVAQLGIDPFPGTLNLLVEGDDLAVWEEVKGETAVIIQSPNPQWCDAHCYPIRIAERYVGAVVVPQLPDYPANHVEIIASISLRETLSLQDGDLLPVARNVPVRAVGIVFDVDGTLVDSIPAYWAIAQHGLTPFGIDVSLASIRQALDSNNPNVWQDLVPVERPNHGEIVAAARHAAIAEYTNALQQHASLLPHVNTTLPALQAAGFRLAIMTGSSGRSMKLLQDENLLDYFEVIVTGKDVARRKPDPEGVLKAASDMNLPPESLVYVGDAMVDMQASTAAGMAGIGVLTGAGDSASLTMAGANWLVSDLSQLMNVVEMEKKER